MTGHGLGTKPGPVRKEFLMSVVCLRNRAVGQFVWPCSRLPCFIQEESTRTGAARHPSNCLSKENPQYTFQVCGVHNLHLRRNRCNMTSAITFTCPLLHALPLFPGSTLAAIVCFCRAWYLSPNPRDGHMFATAREKGPRPASYYSLNILYAGQPYPDSRDRVAFVCGLGCINVNFPGQVSPSAPF